MKYWNDVQEKDVHPAAEGKGLDGGEMTAGSADILYAHDACSCCDY